MVCRLVANFVAIAETLIPAARSPRTSCFCVSLSVEGRPRAFLSDLARLRPDCVRSIGKSRSNCATALSTFTVIVPAELVRSAPPSARQ
jgi:hypothetical protein